ncbi:MAG: cysteine desulfurase family protein [Chloroflexi bacterium]|nr:cysteine desulfurase family protein [Chloroflexota bacterium]
MIYLDHSATTAVDPRALEAMSPFWTEAYGNPSSIYGLGRRAAAALEDARTRIARVLNCQPAEIVFTGCGTESDNLALRGVALAQAARGRRHLITTPIEHHAVLHTAADLAERFDCDVTYVPVDRHGLVDPAAVAAAIRPDTALISVMLANNEVGTIEPVAEIAALARARGIPFHTDAVQAGGYLALDVQALNVDLLALSAHKFYGPKGVGLLYMRRGLRLQPAQTGGSQERNRRAGTENVPYVVGMARALEIAQAEREVETARLSALRDRLTSGLLARIPGAELTGHPTRRLPGHVSLVIRGVEAEPMLIALDLAGVAASSGSACASGSPTPSHVLTAMGYDPQAALGALRLTLGRENTEADVEFVIERLPGIVSRIRGKQGNG